MDEKSQEILFRTEAFVSDLFKDQLPLAMYFHNFEHTLMVVEGVQVIGRKMGFNGQEILVLLLSAFLHDAGYVSAYQGHEERSVMIATEFLAKLSASREIIDQVAGCILATRFPQAPTNALEEVICDADLYHLSFKDYFDYADRLRAEWQGALKREFTDTAWASLNLEMLKTHTYYTTYARAFLQSRKEINIEILQNTIDNQ